MRLEDFADETCPVCKKGFESSRIYQKYCSAECRTLQANRFRVAIKVETARRGRIGMRCWTCDAPLNAKRADQRYCCTPCQTAAKPLSKALAERRRGLTCRCCGAPIADAKRSDKLYCSAACKGSFNTARASERRRRARAAARRVAQ